MSETAPRKKSKVLEATLELGRNWGLATALAAFSVTLYSSEAIHGIAAYRRPVGLAGIGMAMIWIILAIERAVQVVEFQTRTKAQRFSQVVVSVFLIAVGAGIVLSVSSMADNRRFVQICSDYADRPETGVYNDPKCQRLYRERAELADRLNRIPVRKPDH